MTYQYINIEVLVALLVIVRKLNYSIRDATKLPDAESITHPAVESFHPTKNEISTSSAAMRILYSMPYHVFLSPTSVTSGDS